MDFNPYKTLELNRTATDDEIRNAYKKLALKYHPDKPTGDEDEFKQVSKAYQILSDPFQKKVFDTQFDEQKLKTINDFISNFTTIFMSTLHDNLQEKLASKKPDKISLKVDIDIADIYNGVVKKLVVKIKDGTDYIKKSVFISLLEYEDTYMFKGCGDKINGISGDLEVKLLVSSDVVPSVARDEVDKNDLMMYLEISIYEYYYGFDRPITYFNGEILQICHIPWQLDIERCGSYRFVVRNKGLPYLCEDKQKRGNLNIYVSVRFEQISDCLLTENEAVVKTLFQSKQNEYIF
jgi:DnaJ-class molecular chaperone